MQANFSLHQKAFQIAYLAFRISGKIEKQSITSEIERLSIGLIAAINLDDYRLAQKHLRSIEWIVRLVIDAGFLHEESGEAMISECYALDSAIELFLKEGNKQSIDIRGILEKKTHISYPEHTPTEVDSKKELGVSVSGFQRKDTQKKEVFKVAEEASPKSNYGTASSGEKQNESQIGSHIRQAAIIDKIRQKGIAGYDCRMKDIQELFPQTSERTLRYDLQKLVERGFIERYGAGPASSYRTKEVPFLLTPTNPTSSA